MTTQTKVPAAAIDRTSTTPSTTPSTAPSSTPGRTTSTRWALAGLVAGITGAGAVASSLMVDAVYDPDLSADSDKVAERLADYVPQLLAFHVLGTVSAVLMVVFAAGLHRRLRATLGSDSLLPAVASSGVLLTAVMLLLGTGLDTEFIFAAGEPDLAASDNLAFYNHWIGTIPWCWGLLGLAGIALFAAFRAGGVPRWIGVVGLLGGGLTLLFGISPLQYMAGMTGPIGLIVISLGFLAGDRAFRGRA